MISTGTCVTYLTDSNTAKKCWYWPDTDTDTRIGALLARCMASELHIIFVLWHEVMITYSEICNSITECTLSDII